MATYRERRLARAEKLRGWAEAREERSAEAYESSHEMLDRIPFGQPILVGHHSERADRRYRGRAHAKMDAAVADSRKASEMAGRASEIDRQLASSIYDDDADAIERLVEKLARLEAEREKMKAARAAFRKEHREELKGLTAYEREQRMPFAQYEITNRGGTITTTRKRIERLKREREHGPSDRWITARFASECTSCGAELSKGDLIRYNRQDGARCRVCPSEEE